MKTLQTIQKLSKIGKVISTIVFIASIIGVVGCIAGIIALACIPEETFSLRGVTVHGIVEKSDDISIGTCYTMMTIAIIMCAGEAVLAKIAELYFRDELADGTPFTFDGAHKLMRLGICDICIPLGTTIAANIAYEIMKYSLQDVAEMNIDSAVSVGMGIMFILISLLCKYGAELTQSKDTEKKTIS